MKVSTLPYKQTGYFSQLIANYLDGDVNTTNLYSFSFTKAGFEQAVTYRKTKPVNRAALVEALKKQYTDSQTTPSALTLEHINLLANDNTYTVVTGHQLCLFTGPLYLIYKLIDTITLCKQLNEWMPENRFVPIYWMHTEDNDIEEIDHAYLFNKKLHWANAGTGAAGTLNPTGLAPIVAELESILGESNHAKELIALVKESYLNHTTLADATRHFVNALLGQYGLVILDPNEASLKQAFIPVFEDDLTNHNAQKLVANTNTQLEALGYSAQVNPREVNLFYIDKGQRYRLVKTADGYTTAGNELNFSTDGLLTEVRNNPGKFSPNVVLRPLLQETILPNICYVGGGGELAYWLQYKAFFNHYGFELPVLALRSSYMLVDTSQFARMDKFGFTNADLFNSTDNLIKTYLKNTAGAELSFEAERSEAAALYAHIAAKATASDATLGGSIEAEHKKFQNYLASLEAKLLKAQKAKEEASVNQIRKLKESLFPDGTLQERYTNFMQFYIKYGPAFFDGFLKDPGILGKEFTIVKLD